MISLENEVISQRGTAVEKFKSGRDRISIETQKKLDMFSVGLKPRVIYKNIQRENEKRTFTPPSEEEKMKIILDELNTISEIEQMFGAKAEVASDLQVGTAIILTREDNVSKF